MIRKGIFLKIVLPVLITAAGFLVMKYLEINRSEPGKTERENLGALVRVFRVTRQDVPVTITGTGTVRPRTQVTLTTEVTGKVTWVSAHLIPGGFFRKGEPMFRIEDRDYELAVEKARAQLARAELALITEKTSAEIAREEWKHISGDRKKKASPLVFHEPQLKEARANLASARAALEQAEINLSRTRVSAPFNCLVRSENVGSGRYVKPGNSVAELAGTDMAEVVVPLSLAELQWLDLPGKGERGTEPPTLVKKKIGTKLHTWEGKVVRTLGEIDPRSRMARVVVQVMDPYGLEAEDREIDLSIGMFVEVEISGTLLSGVMVIPRSALRKGSTVWVMDEGRKLRIRPVTCIRIEREDAIISSGIREGDKIVLTELAGAVDGLKLRETTSKVQTR